LSELKEIFCHSTDDSLMSAIRRGRTEVVEYLTKYKTDNENPCFIALAAYLGNIDYLKLLHQRDYAWDDTACVDAALQGHLDCLRYLHENGCAWNYNVYIKSASNQHWDCFQFAAEKGLPWHVTVSMRLAQWKESTMLQYAIEHGCPMDLTAMQEAVANGDVDCVRILLNVDCPVPVDSCLVASKSGYLECLILLHEHGANWDEEAPAVAASAGHLPCLQYLHAHSCPWDEKTTQEAAKYGHLNALQYALENGCPYNDDLVATAAGAASIDCLQYLIEEQGLFIGEDGKAFLTAMHYCKPQSVQYLIDQGCNIHNCSTEVQKLMQETDWTLVYLPAADELLLECIQIALFQNWDIRKNGQTLLSMVILYMNILPMCYRYLQVEGYVEDVHSAASRIAQQANYGFEWDVDVEFHVVK